MRVRGRQAGGHDDDAKLAANLFAPRSRGRWLAAFHFPAVLSIRSPSRSPTDDDQRLRNQPTQPNHPHHPGRADLAVAAAAAVGERDSRRRRRRRRRHYSWLASLVHFIAVGDGSERASPMLSVCLLSGEDRPT